MRPKVFNAVALIIAVCFATSLTSLAQSPIKAVAPAVPAAAPVPLVEVTAEPVIVSTTTSSTVNTAIVKVKLHKLNAQLKKLSVQANAQVIAAVKSINADVDADVDDIAPQVNAIISNTVTTTNDDAELVKNYSKTYSVDANDVLSIENKYGNVTVNTWNKNEIKVDVQIKVSADNDDATKKLLDNVNIIDSKNGSSISFRTSIGEMKSSWYSVFQGGSSRKMEINYTVYMPAKNDLVINNSYGGINLPDLDGKVTISSAYGNFKSGALSNESAINVKYGNATMGNLSYCALYLSYGNVIMGAVDRLAANINYSGIKIDKINGRVSLNVRYGDGVYIRDLGRNMTVLNAKISYANLKIGVNGDEAANFDIITHYGDFNYDERNTKVTVTPSDDSKGPNFTKSYKGYVGIGATNNRYIAIYANYGNVKFE